MMREPRANTWSFDGFPSPSNFPAAADSTSVEDRRTCRRGSMFVETAIGIALAAVVMIAVAQLVALVAKQRREVAQARIATQEAANVMEHAMVLPWEALTTDAASQLELSDELASQLDAPQLSITVTPVDDVIPVKKIEVTLSWQDQANRRVEPIRLVAWRHRKPQAE